MTWGPGKIALVTGASRGLGAAIAEQLALRVGEPLLAPGVAGPDQRTRPTVARRKPPATDDQLALDLGR